MPVGWFLAPYVRQVGTTRPTRYVIVDDLTPAIRAEGGDWTESEVLGHHAIVKVSASSATLALVAALPGVDRLPAAALDDPLSTLSVAQRNAIRTKIIALGYPVAELDAALPGDIRDFTLRQVLTFIARRRRKVRHDQASDAILDDGPVQPVRPLADVDAAVV